MNISPTCPCSLVLVALLGLAPPSQSMAQPHSAVTVTSNLDINDNDILCTLREAITAANSQMSYNGCMFSPGAAPTLIAFNVVGVGADPITFNIGNRLPTIHWPVVIDGLTQPGASCNQWPPTLLIEISNPTHGNYNGLTLDSGSDGSTVRGLVINGFSSNQGYAFNFNAAINIVDSDGNRIECNFLGTNSKGTAALPNLRGVDINSSSDNIIGSDGSPKPYFARNLISGNLYAQVNTRGNAPGNNRISGNFIGVDVTGTQAMGSQGSANGVAINAGSASPPATGNIVGWDGVGDVALMRNIISGFSGTIHAGVSMVTNAQGNIVAGNYIGTDVTGMVAIPNFYGVSLGSNAGVHHNVIGSDGSMDFIKARNVISGNNFVGIAINGANGTGNNAVIGNYIGVNADGTGTLGNDDYGLSMSSASADTLVWGNWFAGQATAIRFFDSGSGTAQFINNGGASDTDLPALDSNGNCVLGNTGVLVFDQGGPVPDPNVFEANWWGAPGGPNSPGASSADPSIDATPYLVAKAPVCHDIIFRDGFEMPPPS